MYELPVERFGKAAPLYEDAAYDRAYVEAVFARGHPARLFVDDAERPTSALLCRTYDYFLAGGPESGLRRFIQEAPAEAGVFADLYGYVAMGGDQETSLLGYVALQPAWHDALLEDLGSEMVVWGRRSFEFDAARADWARSWRLDVPPDVRIVEIAGDLAPRVDRELDELIGVFWGAYDRYAAHGFGSCAVVDGVLASACFAISVGRRFADLGVATAVLHRRRGLASLVSRACIGQALDRGLIPTWDCDTVNGPSAALAMHLGFNEGPSFAEIAFPDRAKPSLSRGLWSADPGPDGITLWRRSG